MSKAGCPQDILAVVRDNLNELDHIHVSMAFNRLGKMAKFRDSTPRHLKDDEAFEILVRLARDYATNRTSGSQAIANTTHGIAKLHEAGRLDTTHGSVEDTLAALETAAGRVARDMKPQEVANLIWGYATLQRMPEDNTWAALETAADQVARDMKPQEVANLVWGYATLGRMPGDSTWAALEAAAGRVARDMNSQDVANLVWGYATLGRMPGDSTWAALETAASQVARDMKSQNVTNLVWGYATLGRMPGESTWAALETAAGRVVRDMNSQDVANLIWGYATLGRMPGDSTWAALETAAGRVARDMNSQEATTMLFGYATLSILQDVDQPSIYAVVWNLVCGLEVRDFNQEGLGMLFHVHLMHQFFDSLRSLAVTYPAWLMTEARDAWTHNVQNNNTVSRSHQELASVIESLGVQHKVERITADGCFSMDIYLPEHDVAVEFDGPSHYYHNSDSSSSRDALMTRTAKTELRDLFLAKQCAKVVTVPWFEWRALHSPEARSAYVKKKFVKEAGVDV